MSTIHSLSSPLLHTNTSTPRGILVNLHRQLPRTVSAVAAHRRLRSVAQIGKGALDPTAVGRRGGLAATALTVVALSVRGSAAAASGSKEEFVKKTVASHSIVIFSKSYCPYCSRAKAVFDKLEKVPYVIELDELDDGADIQYALSTLVGRSTVPQVFINGKHIGGSDDTVDAYESGSLQKLLA